MIRRFTCPNFLSFGPKKIEETRKTSIKKVNQYYLVTKIGVGSFSKVFYAIDSTDNRTYAIKQIFSNRKPETLANLSREISILQTVHHPNLISLKEVLYTEDPLIAYMVMELADCNSLQSCIANKIHFLENDIASLIKQITSALAYLLEQRIVHRDIKPGNILLFSNGLAKLSDFGIGHSLDSADSIVGTPAYQAPEIFSDDDSDKLDPIKEDIWSLGVTIYQVITGELPFNGQSMYEIASNIQNTALQLPETLSEPLRDLLLQMLQISPENRINLTGILNHPFILQAPDTILKKLPMYPSTFVDNSMSINEIKALNCPHLNSHQEIYKWLSNLQPNCSTSNSH